MKKLISFLTVFMLMFTALQFVAPHSVDAKSYKSGKKSYTPSQNEPTVKSKDSTVNSSKLQQDTKTAPKASNKGSFVKGMLLGGIGGLLLGSLFAGLGPIGTVLALLVNVMLTVGVIMMIRKLYLHWKKRKKQERQV